METIQGTGIFTDCNDLIGKVFSYKFIELKFENLRFVIMPSLEADTNILLDIRLVTSIGEAILLSSDIITGDVKDYEIKDVLEHYFAKIDTLVVHRDNENGEYTYDFIIDSQIEYYCAKEDIAS